MASYIKKGSIFNQQVGNALFCMLGMLGVAMISEKKFPQSGIFFFAEEDAY